MDFEWWCIGFFVILFRWFSFSQGNLKCGKSTFKAIESSSNANPYKNAVCVSLNEWDFPPLPSPGTRYKPICSPVKLVGPVVKLLVFCQTICSNL